MINETISSCFTSYKGVLQDSILSPLLFNIYTSNLKLLLHRDCQIVQFADDIALFVRSDDLDASLRALDRSANNLSKYLSTKGLIVSESKSALMIFSRKKIKSHNHSIVLNGSFISPVQSHKFLGIYLDSFLNGHIHAQHLINKCGKLSNILKSVRGTWWGADPRTLLTIFKTLIRGSIEYGSFLFPTQNS